MKTAWFSLFKRKSQHRGTVIAYAGLKTGCIQICPVCEKPLTPWELQTNEKFSTGSNELVRDFDSKPDRIYMTMRVTCILSGNWGGNQNYPHLICSLCYLKSLQHTVDQALESAKNDRARVAYDAELDCEILTTAWGITEEDFNRIGKCRGDLEVDAHE